MRVTFIGYAGRRGCFRGWVVVVVGGGVVGGVIFSELGSRMVVTGVGVVTVVGANVGVCLGRVGGGSAFVAKSLAF